MGVIDNFLSLTRARKCFRSSFFWGAGGGMRGCLPQATDFSPHPPACMSQRREEHPITPRFSLRWYREELRDVGKFVPGYLPFSPIWILLTKIQKECRFSRFFISKLEIKYPPKREEGDPMTPPQRLFDFVSLLALPLGFFRFPHSARVGWHRADHLSTQFFV